MQRFVIITACAVLLATSAFAQGSLPPVDPFSVVLCEHVDFIAPCRTYTVESWMRHKLVPSLGDLNDKISSIRVGSQVEALLFERANFQGDQVLNMDYRLRGDLRDLTSFNDDASSLIVIPKGRHKAGGGVSLDAVIQIFGLGGEEGFFPLPERASETVAKYPYVGSFVNDAADCIGLFEGVTVDLFEHPNFTGQRTRLPGMTGKGTASPDCIAQGHEIDLKPYKMNEKVSSLIVYADKKRSIHFDDAVVISKHVDHVGASRQYDLEPGMRYRLVPGLEHLNDKTSSVIVGTNVSVHVFEHTNFGGRTAELTDTTAKVGSWLDNHISSLVVAQRGAVFEGAVLSGPPPFTPQYFFPLPEMLAESEARYPSIGSDLNDKSIKLSICGEHVSVTLYRHANYAGEPRDVPGRGPKPAPCVSYRLHDYQFGKEASSLVVRTAAVAPKLVRPDIPVPPPPRGGDAAGEPHRAPPVLPDMKFQTTKAGPVSLELNSNRPGHDYRDFDLRRADPELCREECARDRRCRAYSYIKPGIQGEHARCWLKDGVPPAEHAPCCASGVKH